MHPLVKKILLILLLIAAVFEIRQTNHMQRLSGTGDLRNRVVGARLMKDGKLPYYYHWYPGDPLRYTIERLIDTSHRRRVNNITAPPSFHRLITPIADYDEPIIERGFFITFYALLGLIALLVYRESKNLLLTLTFFVAFLFTDGWWHHISLQQYYFLFAFLLFFISFLLYKKQWIWAGLFFALLVILRINCVVIMIPFLLYFKRYKTFILSAAAGVMVYAIIVCSLPFERANWIEYFGSLKEATAIHLFEIPGENRTLNLDTILPKSFEGENFLELEKKSKMEHLNVAPEATNLVFLYRKLYQKAPPLFLLQGLYFASMAFIIIAVYWRDKNKGIIKNIPIGQLILSGLLFYFLSNLYSPIVINPYQMPQWISVIGMLVIMYRKIPVWVFLVFSTGIVFNFRFLPHFMGSHLLAEGFFLLGTFCAIIWGKWQASDKPESLDTSTKKSGE